MADPNIVIAIEQLTEQINQWGSTIAILIGLFALGHIVIGLIKS